MEHDPRVAGRWRVDPREYCTRLGRRALMKYSGDRQLHCRVPGDRSCPFDDFAGPGLHYNEQRYPCRGVPSWSRNPRRHFPSRLGSPPGGNHVKSHWIPKSLSCFYLAWRSCSRKGFVGRALEKEAGSITAMRSIRRFVTGFTGVERGRGSSRLDCGLIDRSIELIDTFLFSNVIC